MQEKRDYFKQLMQQTRFTMHDSFGSYFICGSYERISEEADKDLAIRLTKKKPVWQQYLFLLFITMEKMIRCCVLFFKKERNTGNGCGKTITVLMPIDSRYKGIFYMLLAALGFSLMGGAAKLLKGSFGAGQLVFWRNAVGLMVLIAGFLIKPPVNKGGKFHLLIFRGMMGTTALYTLCIASCTFLLVPP